MKNFLLNMALAFTNRLGTGEASGTGGTTQGSIDNVDKLVKAFTNVFQWILGPIFTIIGIAGVAYAIYLGVLYAKAEDASKRKEVQGRLIGAIIGAVIIIAGAVVCYALNWEKIFNNFNLGTL